VQTGSDAGRAVTPAGVAALTGSTTRAGLAGTATEAAVNTGSDNTRYVTPAGLMGSQGIVRADDGRKFCEISGVLRTTGSGFAWIADTGHARAGFNATVTQDADKVTINYDFTASKVVSLVAAPDDGFARLGYLFGSSVGVSSAEIWAG